MSYKLSAVNCNTSISIDHDHRALNTNDTFNNDTFNSDLAEDTVEDLLMIKLNLEKVEAMEACRQTKRKRYSAVGETEVDQEELLQSAKKRSREDVDDEVGGWRDVDDELDSLRDDLDKSF